MHYPSGDGYTLWNGKRIFTDGSPGVADGTTIEEQWLNAVTLEIINAIIGGGLSPNESTETKEEMVQLLAAIEAIAAIPLWDTGGSGNYYTITPSPAVTSLTDGQKFRFKADRSSTYWPPLQYGCELKINDLPSYGIVKADGTDLDEGGAIQDGQIVTVTWHADRSKFQIEAESNILYEGLRSEIIDARGNRTDLAARLEKSIGVSGYPRPNAIAKGLMANCQFDPNPFDGQTAYNIDFASSSRLSAGKYKLYFDDAPVSAGMNGIFACYNTSPLIINIIDFDGAPSTVGMSDWVTIGVINHAGTFVDPSGYVAAAFFDTADTRPEY